MGREPAQPGLRGRNASYRGAPGSSVSWQV